MRRLVAYSAIAAGMLVAVGVSLTPVLTEMNPGREFTRSHEISFKIESYENGVDLPLNAAEKVADEMRSRLDNFNIEDYSVKIQNTGSNEVDKSYQMVAVSMACNESTFNKACKYLTFSGHDMSISTTGSDETSFIDDVIDYDKVYVTVKDDRTPIVVVPLTSEGKEKLTSLIEKIPSSEETSEGGETRAPKRALRVNAEDEEEDHDHENEDQGEQADLFIWSNAGEGGINYTTAQSDPNLHEKLICELSSKYIWYTEADGAKEDEANTAIKLVCNPQDVTEEGLKEAFNNANYFLNLFKASKYNYSITCPTANVTMSGTNYFTNALEVAPQTKLIAFENNATIATSTVLITTIIAFAAIIGCLIAYYKLFAAGIIATTISTVFLSYLATIKMGILFNIPVLIGGILIFTTSLFGQIFHINRLRNEVYRGRSLKKANQEAGKKSTLVTIDASVILAFTGLMFFLFGGMNGGTSVKPLGSILFFGAFVVLLMNLIVFRLLMHIITSSTALQKEYKVFNISEHKVPNVMQEQKEQYVAPFEKVPYTKPKRIAGIILGALSVLAVVGIMVFGIKDGSPLNIGQEMKNSTVIYTTLKLDSTQVNTEQSYTSYILEEIPSIKEAIDDEEVLVETKMNRVEKFEEEEPQTCLYFTTKIDKEFSLNDLIELSGKITEKFDELAIGDASNYDVSVLNSHEVIYTPNQGVIALATSISIIGVSVYFMFRFKPSRGIAALAVATASSLISYGLMSLLHFPTSAVASLCMPIVAVSILTASLVLFATEKSLLADAHEELTPELRKEILKQAIGKCALPTFIYLVIAVFISLIYFGFGIVQTTVLFAGTFVGLLIGSASLFIVVGPFAEIVSNWFAKIRMPKLKFLQKKEKQNPYQVKKNSSEPEETIFIGIND